MKKSVLIGIIIAAVILIGVIIGICVINQPEEAKYYGTWDIHSVKIDGSVLTLDEVEAIYDDDSLNSFKIIIKEGGKVYVYADGESELLDWTLTENGEIKLGDVVCVIEDEMLSFTLGEAVLYFEKTSKSQTITNSEDSNNQSTTTTTGKKTTTTTSTTTAKKSTTTTTTKKTTTTTVQNGVTEEELELLSETVANDVEDRISALEEEWELLKASITNYNEYAANLTEIEEFYSKIIQECINLQICLYEYSIEYTEIILAGSESNYDKYDFVEIIYDSICDEACDEMYDRICDELLDDMYDAFYGGVLEDAYEYISWDEYYDVTGEEYDRWLDTYSDTYDIYLDTYSETYDFYLDVASDILSGETDDVQDRIDDLKGDIEKVK